MSVSAGDTTFREGDKVMQTRNNYQLKWKKDGAIGIEDGQGVFNGDIGFVTFIDPQEHVMEVQFDDERTATYEGGDVDDLELAYCISVHKSQGSESPRRHHARSGRSADASDAKPVLYRRNTSAPHGHDCRAGKRH